jgi:dipeptidyl aminopeptidase/acylaminoacyl peptidase
MKNIKPFLRSTINVIVLGVLVLSLIALFSILLPKQQTASPSILGKTPISAEALVPTSIPLETSIQDTPYPAPPRVIPPGLNTPWPTFTPFPTPTLKPGPTATLIPLPIPAKDAEGTIWYLAKDNMGSKSLYALAVDSAGKIINPGSKVSTTNEAPDGDVYPSPDGAHLAIIGAWGVGGILDAQDGKYAPFPIRWNRVIFYSWFPDNHRFLYRDDRGNLILVDPSNGEYAALFVPGYGAVDGAAASPDGRSIIYAYKNEVPPATGKTGIWLVNSDGREARLLTEIPGGPVYNFSWSPDGSQVAFFGAGIMVMNADGSNLHSLTGSYSIPQCYFHPPLWSPNSRYLAVVSAKAGQPFCHGWWGEETFRGTTIYIIDVVKGESHPLLSDGSQGNIDPAWSPDGKQVAFVSNRSGVSEIWAVSVDGTGLTQLTSEGLQVRFPYWSRP